jgi:hypothetical protein
MSFIVSLYESLFRPRAALHELSGQELVELLTTPQRVFNITDKRTLPMWSPVRLSPSYRRKDNVVCASCLVLDYDDGTTIDVAMATWSRWYRILHTSWSHRPDKHRFRLVLPLQRDVTPEEYPALWRWAEVFADRQVDKACKDISRAWALPATDQSNKQHVGQFEWKVGTGDLLAPDEVIPLAPPPPIKVNYKRVNLRDLPDSSHLREVHLTPESRAELGHALGGVVSASCVKLVECPRCRREAAWWWLDPDIQILAYCNHRASCGWKGPLISLVEYQRAIDINDAMKA